MPVGIENRAQTWVICMAKQVHYTDELFVGPRKWLYIDKYSPPYVEKAAQEAAQWIKN